MDLVRRLLFPAYILSLIYPLASWSDYQASDIYSDMVGRWQIVGFGFIIVTALVNARSTGAATRVMLFPFAAFTGWAAISTVWSIDPGRSALSVFMLGIFVLACCLFWRSDERITRDATFYTACAIFLGFGWLLLLLPVTGRSLGGITPNLPAHYGLAAIVLSHYARRLVVPITFVGIAIIIFAQARGVLIAASVFLGIRYFIVPILWRAKNPALSFSLLISGTVAMGVGMLSYLPQLIGVISRVANVQDTSRLDNSLTGRTEAWEIGLHYIEQSPLIGYGFRTRDTFDRQFVDPSISAHSGMINVALDLGLIGAALFVLWYLASVYRGLRASNTLATASSFLIANIPLLIAEPTYLSFAHPTAFVMLLSMCAAMVVQQREPAGSSVTDVGNPGKPAFAGAGWRR